MASPTSIVSWTQADSSLPCKSISALTTILSEQGTGASSTSQEAKNETLPRTSQMTAIKLNDALNIYPIIPNAP